MDVDKKIFQNENGDRIPGDYKTRGRPASVICAQFNVSPSHVPFDKNHPNQISFFRVRNQRFNNSVQEVLSVCHGE